MKIIKPLLIVSSIFLSQISFASDDQGAGEKLFKTNCAVCHGSTGGMDLSKRIAPPIAAVRMHYIDTYPDEASFVAAVSSWVEKQDESKSLMRGAINKFKIMPPLAVSKEDAAKIATYIYGGDIEKPEGFEQHVEEEHGKNGEGKMHSEGMHEQGSEMHNMKGMHEQGGGMHNMEEMRKKMQGQHQGKGMGMRGQGNGMRQMMQGRGMQGQQQRMMNMRQRMQGEMRRGGNGKRGSMSAQMMQQLNLSSSQQQQMQSLIQEKQSRLQPVKKEMHQINQAIRQLDTTSPNYKSQIFSLADEKAKRIHRMVIERGEMRMKIEAVLNLEQRKQFNQLRQQHNNNH